MNGIYYILEANLYLLAFYACYKLFLAKETFYASNRYYLMASTLLAFALPLMQAGFLFNLMPALWQHSNADSSAGLQQPQQGPGYFSWQFLIPATYLCIAGFFVLRLCANIFKVLWLAWNAKSMCYEKVKYRELQTGEVAFSFFNILFLNPNAAEKNIIIRHEEVHIQQYHSLDTLFLEIVHAISWFNPLLIFLKADLNSLHEFIADDLACSEPSLDKHQYAMLLIQNSFGLPQNALTKHIYNQISLKERIKMLNQPKSASWARLRLLLVLPVTCAMICSSTLVFSKSYKVFDLFAGKQVAVQNLQQDSTKRIPPPPPLAAPKPPKGLRSLDVPPPPRAPKAPKAARPVKAAKAPKTMPLPPPPPPAAQDTSK